MNDQTDQQLLRDYAERQSEAAFAAIVHRYVDLVYSAAVRMVCDAHAAKDVTQSVFVVLAQNARQLTDRPALAGWLHGTARNIAAKTVRSDVRRRAREQEAAVMNELLSANPDANWEHIALHLDAALGELSEPDRDAVLLRYFKNHDLHTVGATLGISDDAAQKRVSRAVERLREFFSKRGVSVGTSGLAVVISANAVQAAPVGLAVTISTAAALAGTSIVTTATATATKAIAMTTLQKTLLAITVVAASVGTPVLIQHQAQVKLREENISLRRQVEQLSPLAAENERLSNLVTQPSPALSREQLNDLLRLRNEVGVLRRQTNELVKLREENRRLQGAQARAGQNSRSPSSPPSADTSVDLPRETWTFAGYINPESAILSLASAAVAGNLEIFLNSMTPDQQARQLQKWQSDGKSDTQIRDGLVKEFGRTETIRILKREQLSESEIILTLFVDQGGGRSETPRMKVQRIGDEWKMAGPPEAQDQP